MKTKFTRICTSILLFFALTLSAYAQQVSGTVSDENGVPLPGATVVVEELLREFQRILMVIIR